MRLQINFRIIATIIILLILYKKIYKKFLLKNY